MNVAEVFDIPYATGECATGGMALGRLVAGAYRRRLGNGIIAVGGSVGRGDADRFSDLELFAFWDEAPSADRRREVVASLGGDLWTIDRDGEAMEHFGIGELQIDERRIDGTSMISVSHYHAAAIDSAINRVFRQFEPDAEDQALLAIVRDAIAMEESPLLERWRGEIATYPKELACRVIRDNLGFGSWFIPHALAARGDRLALHAQMHDIEHCLWRVLAALNGVLVAFPSGKWTRRSDAWLLIAPTDFRGRLESSYGTDLAAGWRTMLELMMETVDLVERWVGNAFEADFFRSVRKRWDPLPPYTLMLAASREIGR